MAAEGVFEKKYLIKPEDSMKFLRYLQHSAAADERFSSSGIRTTYFDDKNHTHYMDTANGELLRRKFRLREYLSAQGRENEAYFAVEVKIRDHMAVRKDKLLSYKNFPSPRAFGSFQELITNTEKLTGHSAAKIRRHVGGKALFPDISVTYRRNRFEDKSGLFRMNFDQDIRLWRWSGLRPAQYHHRIPYSIFEVKCAHDTFDFPLPKGIGTEVLARSKYMWGKEIIRH